MDLSIAELKRKEYCTKCYIMLEVFDYKFDMWAPEQAEGVQRR